MDLMHDRREKNSLVTKLVAAIVISVLGCIVGVLGWIGATVWLSALKIAALEANQDSIKSEAMEIKKEAKEMNAALIRIEEVIKRQKGALP